MSEGAADQSRVVLKASDRLKNWQQLPGGRDVFPSNLQKFLTPADMLSLHQSGVFKKDVDHTEAECRSLHEEGKLNCSELVNEYGATTTEKKLECKKYCQTRVLNIYIKILDFFTLIHATLQQNFDVLHQVRIDLYGTSMRFESESGTGNDYILRKWELKEATPCTKKVDWEVVKRDLIKFLMNLGKMKKYVVVTLVLNDTKPEHTMFIDKDLQPIDGLFIYRLYNGTALAHCYFDLGQPIAEVR